MKYNAPEESEQWTLELPEEGLRLRLHLAPLASTSVPVSTSVAALPLLGPRIGPKRVRHEPRRVGIGA
jgi:hypothetical protein